MTITLNLKPEIEARLFAQAAKQGLSIEQFLQSWIESSLPPETKSAENWRELLDEFCNHPALANIPPVSDDAVSLTYLEREDSQR